jgi:hypothetical protein
MARNLFITYNNFIPEERSRYEIDGPRYYILNPFTYLRNTAIEVSRLLPEFSLYLAASHNQVRLSPQLKELRKVQFVVRGVYGCFNNLGKAWKYVKAGGYQETLDRAWKVTVLATYEVR